MFYQIDYECDDGNPFQGFLNSVCGYKQDLSTKILHRKRLNLFSEILCDLKSNGIIKNFDSAIDIGCGAGIYSKILSDVGFARVLGVDISEDGIEIANRTFSMKDEKKEIGFMVADAQNLDRSIAYDFILCTEVIEHVDHPERVIEGINGLLKEDGIAIVSMPNLISLPYLATLMASKMGRKIDSDMRSHMKYPFYKTIGLFRRSGFEIIKSSGTNLIFNTPILRLLYGKASFSAINEADSSFSRRWPFLYFSQFFFLIIRKK